MHTDDAKSILSFGYLKKEVVTQGKKTSDRNREEERERHILKYSSRACGLIARELRTGGINRVGGDTTF